MKRLSLVVAAVAIVGAGNAEASEGIYDQYGYQSPNKYTRPATQAKTQPSKIFSFGTPPKASKMKAYSAQNGNMSGGARPSIAPTSPPKVNFHSGYGAGQIVIDQSARKLYYTVSSSKAYMYPIAVGKEGFKWTGTQKISKKVDWPDWRPPAEMRERKPNLPVSMTGGVYNPLGAKALYLGNTLYRIHGTNDPKSIGTAASSGCIRMYNGHVVHLSSMAGVGTTVHVVSRLPKTMASN
ncbi:MAG: L,D-transpeptidase [Hyphomicrobium sp.]|jgi:lipoprotein-anchoring transpeptidase ErfK/SrfK|nr:L,D-transpeptidase [Hyphomicrobium sp.]